MFLQLCRDELVLSFIFVQRLVSWDRTRLRKGTTAETQRLDKICHAQDPTTKSCIKAKSVQEQEKELRNGVSFPAKKEVKFESFVHLLEIVEVKKYTEHDKFRAIDKFERTVGQKLSGLIMR